MVIVIVGSRANWNFRFCLCGRSFFYHVGFIQVNKSPLLCASLGMKFVPHIVWSVGSNMLVAFSFFQNVEQVVALTTQGAQPIKISRLCPAIEIKHINS
jgi:hypothetical protein